MAVLVTMASWEAHLALVRDTLRGMSHERRAAFMASALTRAGRFYRSALSPDDEVRRTLDSVVDEIWRNGIVGSGVDSSLISVLAPLWPGEDDSSRYPHEDEFLGTADLFLSFLLDRRFEGLQQSLARLLDLWKEAAYDSEGFTEYTRENDEAAWATPLMRRESAEQLEDLRLLATRQVDAGFLRALRARAENE